MMGKVVVGTLVFGVILFMIITAASGYSATKICTPGTTKCSEGKMLGCNGEGTAWTTTRICPYGCLNEFSCKETNHYCGDGTCNSDETTVTCPTDCPGNIFTPAYESARKAAGIPDSNLEETWDYDYSNPTVSSLSYSLKTTSDPLQAAKNVAAWTYNNIAYTLDGNDCETATASSIISRKWGLCSTMSKANVAILRGMGLAARIVGGCYSPLGSCTLLSVILGQPGPHTNYVMKNGKIYETGGAHAWVNVWIPNNGWVLLESTAGYVANIDCSNYLIYKTDPQTDDGKCWQPSDWYYGNCINR